MAVLREKGIHPNPRFREQMEMQLITPFQLLLVACVYLNQRTESFTNFQGEKRCFTLRGKCSYMQTTFSYKEDREKDVISFIFIFSCKIIHCLSMFVPQCMKPIF